MAVFPESVAKNRALLSNSQLKRLTKESGAPWPEILIKDYQGILKDTIETITIIGDVEDQSEANRIAIEILQLEVEDLQDAVIFLREDVDGLIDRVAEIEAKEIKVYTTSISYTAEPYQVILCTNTTPINITLNPTPSLNEIANIKRTNAEVNILGTIDGLTNWTLNVQRYSMQLIFNGTDWSEI